MDQAIVSYVNPQQKKPKASRKRRQIDTKEDDLDLKLYSYPWKINKILTTSDLNGLSRLIIPSDQVKTHILPFMTLENRQKMELLEGIRVSILDLESWSKHDLTFKKWPTNNSYVLVSNWSEFAQSKNLCEDEEIGMIWVKDDQSFYFKLVKEHPQPPPPPPPPSNLLLFGRELTLGLPGTSTGLIPTDQNVVIAGKPLQCRSGHNMTSTTATTTSTVRRPQVRRFMSVPRCEIDLEDFAQTVKAVQLGKTTRHDAETTHIVKRN